MTNKIQPLKGTVKIGDKLEKRKALTDEDLAIIMAESAWNRSRAETIKAGNPDPGSFGAPKKPDKESLAKVRPVPDPVEDQGWRTPVKGRTFQQYRKLAIKHGYCGRCTVVKFAPGDQKICGRCLAKLQVTSKNVSKAYWKKLDKNPKDHIKARQREARRRYYKKSKARLGQRFSELQKQKAIKFRAKQSKKGRCHYCVSLAVPGKTRCNHHLTLQWAAPIIKRFNENKAAHKTLRESFKRCGFLGYLTNSWINDKMKVNSWVRAWATIGELQVWSKKTRTVAYRWIGFCKMWRFVAEQVAIDQFRKDWKQIKTARIEIKRIKMAA